MGVGLRGLLFLNLHFKSWYIRCGFWGNQYTFYHLKYPIWKWGVMARTQILVHVSVHCDLDLGSKSWHFLGSCTTLCEILSRSNLALRTRIFDMCVLWHWPWRYDLGSMLWYTWVMDNKCVKFHSDQTWQWRVMDWKLISGMCVLWHWPWR